MPRRQLGATHGTRLYADQWPALAQRAKEEGPNVTVSDVIRDFIDTGLGNPVDPPDVRARLKAEAVAVLARALDEWGDET